MSQVTFASPNRSVEVKGFERARAFHICVEMTMMMVDEPRVLGALLPPKEGELKRFFNDVHVTDREFSECPERLRSFLLCPTDTFLLPDGREISTWAVCLNTVMRMGNDVIQFLARFHGQCELHAYVEGRNRWWLSDLLEKGLRSKVLSAEAGWQDVIILLRDSVNEPVVMSYSVCRDFPDYSLTVFDEQSWETLAHKAQWDASMTMLRRVYPSVELFPVNWESYQFETGHTIMDLIELCHKEGGS